MPLVVGIRPEAFRLTAQAGDVSFSGTVDLIELTGPEKIVSVDIAGQPLIATFPAQTRLSLGERVDLHADPARLSAFEHRSGQRVNLAGPRPEGRGR